MPDDKTFEWIHRARDNGWGSALHLTLDALEPLGPLGAQLLWVLQPALGMIVPTQALSDLANTLEQPDGIEVLRRELAATDDADAS